VRTLLALLLLLVLQGCAPAVPFDHLTISTEFPPHVQTALVDAAERWFAVSPGLRVPVTIGDPANVRITPYGAAGDEECTNSSAYVVWSFLEPPEVRFCDADPANIAFLSLHELGHALGGRNDHLPEGNVMFPHAWGGALQPTAMDLDYVEMGP
jgi:hypothetical protein